MSNNNIAIIAQEENHQDQNNNGNSIIINDNIEEEQITSIEIASSGVIYSFAYYDALNDLCKNNAEYFRKDDTENGQRIYGAVTGIIDHLVIAKNLVVKILEFAHEYDFDEHTPGNGYRSFVDVVKSCINHTVKTSAYVMQHRSSILFRKSHYMKELEACNQYLSSISSCLKYLVTMHNSSEKGCLFPIEEHTAADVFATAETINQFSFYGRCVGIQFHDSIKPTLKFLTIVMAGFAESYYRDGGTISKMTSSMWTSGHYYINPEMRAKRIVNISHYAGVDFCKAFWSLSENEFLNTLPYVVGPNLKINKVITIPPEPLQLQDVTTNEWIDIPIPHSHLGTAPVLARFLSYNRRTGMMGERKNLCNNSLKLSKGFIFHCHGGGFIATSSRTHEIYLRQWAIELDLPILSIDYSLAPEAPYPRALEEVFYAYCWAIKNCALLGSTGERIICAGDSAGAALNLAIAIKTIEMNIRKPDGLFLVYSPVRMSFTPTPARLLAILDPVVPFGFLLRCMKAYVCPSEEILNENKKKLAEKEAILGTKHIGIKNHNKNINSNNSSLSSSQPSGSSMGNKKIVNGGSGTNGADDDGGGGSSSNKITINEVSTFGNVLNDKQIRDDSDIIDNNVDSKNSDTLNTNGLLSWEHINLQQQQNDNSLQDMNKLSPMSDRTSDTFASASLQSSQTIGNTDMITPDDSNGISFEEDSQPITIHKPFIDTDLTYEANTNILNRISEDDIYRAQSAAEAIEFDNMDNNNNNGNVNGTDNTDNKYNNTVDKVNDDDIIKNEFVVVDNNNKFDDSVATTTTTTSTTKNYVTEFMEKYVLETTIDNNGQEHPILRSVPRTQSEENILIDESREAITVENIQNKIYKVAGDMATTVTSTFNSLTTATPINESYEYSNGRNRLHKSNTLNNDDNMDESNSKSKDGIRHPADDFNFVIPNDHYLSPYTASDEILKQMPKLKIITTNMDPCLDDCIMLAKKMKSFNHNVTLDILEALPHGFLNFIKVSKEASEGNKLCIKRLAELFDLKLVT